MNAWGVLPQKVKQMFKASLKVENIDLSGQDLDSVKKKKHSLRSTSLK